MKVIFTPTLLYVSSDLAECVPLQPNELQNTGWKSLELSLQPEDTGIMTFSVIAVRPLFSLAYGCIMQRRCAYSSCCTCRRSWYEAPKASVLTSWQLSPPVMPGQRHLWGGVIIIIFPSRTALRLPLFYIFVISFGIPGQPSRTFKTTAMCAQFGGSEKVFTRTSGDWLGNHAASGESTLGLYHAGSFARMHFEGTWAQVGGQTLAWHHSLRARTSCLSCNM